MNTYDTLAVLLTQWEQGDLSLEEMVARWPHDDAVAVELLHELLGSLISIIERVRQLEVCCIVRSA